MFNITQIQSCFSGLVGFKSTQDPQYPVIINELKSPATGKFVSHPLCNVENIYNSGPDYTGFITIGESEQLRDVAFNETLTEIYNESSANLVSKLIEMKKINDDAKMLLDSQELYTGFGYTADKVIKKSRFVGFQISTSRMRNIMVIISRLGFQVDTVQTVDFYVYHSSKSDPLYTIPFEILRGNSFSWKTDLQNIMLSYMSGVNSDGVFYLGYYEDDLQGQAIRMDKTLQNRPCMTCSGADIYAFNAWSKYINVQAIEVDELYLQDDKTLFDTGKIEYTNGTNWGINLSISTVCDLTEFFCSNKASFTAALCNEITLNVITRIAYSTRLNGVTDKTKGLAMADLNLKDPSAFVNEHANSLKALSIDFSGFDKNCLPCRKNSGMTFSAI